MAKPSRPYGLSMTFEEALEDTADLLHQVRVEREVDEFKQSLVDQSSSLESLVRLHLGLGPNGVCKVEENPEKWMTGAFNVVVPVCIGSGRRVVIRCPIPAKHAESQNPGSLEEKMVCEVATYVWMQRNCPDIRIPLLYGFGLPDGRHFSHFSQLCFLARLYFTIWHSFTAILGSQTHPYARITSSHSFPSGYMVLEYLDLTVGKRVSFNDLRNETKRLTLFRNISRIFLAVSRHPQPCIGAYRFQGDGDMSLTNRPLTAEIMILENQGAPQTIARDETYNCADAYISDLITFHDKRFLSNPNAVGSEYDGRQRMATKSLLRATFHHFYPKQYRNRPFILQLTDFHIGNFLVDDDCNITAIIDLEWMVSRPVTMLAPPYWIWGRELGDLSRPKFSKAFELISDQFMDVFEEEERQVDMSLVQKALGGATLSSVMRETLSSQRFWFNYSLDSVNAMYILARRRLFPEFHFPSVPLFVYPASLLWHPRASRLVAEKLNDHRTYTAELAKLFNEPIPPQEPEPGMNNAGDGQEMDEAMQVVRKYMASKDEEYGDRTSHLMSK